ncbi:hypothetical protein [Rhizobium sp. YK2]|uniref:hypothetical protein n=1 Tax=Rhizobium sp. YK2 TaxID=1860096 RepID=UPI00084C15F0|nr:hypothetical protein [Rhizobium sp. YK2]OEC93598.1 hypothetical protein A9Z06_09220 [Rhizobium sp. YK2]
MTRPRQTGSKTQKTAKKPHKKNVSLQARMGWVYFLALIGIPGIIMYRVPRQTWAHVPWVIGPVAWLATIAAVISFLWSLITRKGLTIGSLVSCMALAAFIIAAAVFLLSPPIGPLLTLLLAQLAAAVLAIVLAFPLRMVQVGMNPIPHTKFRSVTNLESLGRMLLGAIAIVGFWDGLTTIFYHARCEDLTISADAEKCMNGEVLLGAHGPFSDTYYAAYFGILAFAPLMVSGFQVVWQRTKRSDDMKKVPEDGLH